MSRWTRYSPVLTMVDEICPQLSNLVDKTDDAGMNRQTLGAGVASVGAFG
jgi:hypothetical protein